MKITIQQDTSTLQDKLNQTWQTINGQRHAYDPNANYWTYGGVRHFLFYNPNAGNGAYGSGDVTGGYGAPNYSPPDPPPHLRFTFDTIGQTIYRMIGHCRVPLRTIWALGVEESGEETVSNTQTFAAALGSPIDPEEEGEIFGLWDSGTLVMNEGGFVAPIGWSDEDAALLASSLARTVIYPGDEAQLPSPLISADKGVSRTNAFRGLRYVIFPDYPINGGSGGGGGGGGGSGLPNLTVEWRRQNDGEEEDTGAVEFLAGAT